MFVGHLAVSLAARRADRATSLVWFVVAANLIDLLWPFFLVLGVERARIAPGASAFTPLAFEHYPWTHSLLMVLVWAAILAAIARWRGVGARGTTLVGALVVSHWVLDLVTHVPDLPLWPGSETVVGLALWRSIPATYAVEGLLWLAAIVLYLGARRPRGAQGHLALWSFVGVSTVMWATGPYSPPPPDERSLAWFAMIGWVIVPWAWWIERTSEARAPDAPGHGAGA